MCNILIFYKTSVSQCKFNNLWSDLQVSSVKVTARVELGPHWTVVTHDPAPRPALGDPGTGQALSHDVTLTCTEE
ncbi:hypothetical protein DPMN_172397 [Dreissena polymorpha]|uniref:Uncharacterized protein n=1 Tax=Dreissena polymorpha TaxID=45954 RepID=A0A9D4DZT4_DREPO|nr:hypothetical protein DPMN_171487 [Dreissena polymorpha]KAH3771095.1 hypothetical protein DPMN_172397 [Dreissena polymorpha]